MKIPVCTCCSMLMMYCFNTGLHTKVAKTPIQLFFCPLAYKQMIFGYFSDVRLSLPSGGGGGHSITKHTERLAQRSESKTPKYLSKNSNIKNAKIIPPKHSERLAVWDKFSFSLRIAPLIIHMNHFSYPLTTVQINIVEEPQNIFFPIVIPDPILSSQPSRILNPRVPPPPVFACPKC